MDQLFSEFLPPARRRSPYARCAGFYLALLFFLLPLVYWDGYFAITEAKAVCFAALSALFLPAAAACAAADRQLGVRRESRRLSGGELCLLVFAGVFLLACLCSGAVRETLLGETNRYQGLAAAALYAGVYFALSRRSDSLSPWALAGLFGAFGLVCALAVLNQCGADPLGLQAPLSAFDWGRYVSTVGNINFLSAYVTLLLPVCLLLLCWTERRRPRLALAVLSALGVCGAMASRSESTVLGLTAALALLPLLLRDSPAALRRAPLLLPGLLAVMQCFALLSRTCGAYGFSALTGVLLRPWVSAALAGLGAGLFFLLRRREAEALRRLCRAYGIGLAAALGALALFLLLMNTVFASARWGALSDYAVIDADWGTDRGRIWLSCGELYRSFPWWRKLIGGGAGVLARWDRTHRVFPDAIVDAAHSEYLHYLLTAGALGLAAYLGLLACTARDTLRRDRRPLSLALLLGAAAYAVQAAVNIAQPCTTPLLFVFLAVLAGRARSN